MLRPVFAIRLLAGAVVAGLFAACSSSTTTPSIPVSPTSASATVTVPQAAASVTLPAVGGYSPAVQVAAGAPSGLSMAVTSSTVAPTNAPQPSSVRRSPQAIAGASPFLYVTFTVSASVSSQVFAAETLGLSSAPLGVNYSLEFDDVTASPATKLATVAGTATGTTVTFNNTTGSGTAAPTLATGHVYLMMFYTTPVSGPTATPTATPSTVPQSCTATPIPAPSPQTTTPPAGNYTFGSGTTTATLQCASGASTAVTLPAYGPLTSGTVTLDVPFDAAGKPELGTTMSFATAIGNGDVSPTPFPTYSPSSAVLVYLKTSTSVQAFFAKTPGLVLNASAFPGTQCALYNYAQYTATGGGPSFTWQLAVGPYATTNGRSAGTLTIPGAPVNAGNDEIDATPGYSAIVCQ